MKRLVLSLVSFFVLLTPTVHATSYYVSASGSDLNNGTSVSTPWRNAPGTAECSAVCASAEPENSDSVYIMPDDVSFCEEMFGARTITDCGFQWDALQAYEAMNFHAIYAPTISISSAGTITILDAPLDPRCRIRILSISIANGATPDTVTVSFSETNQRVYSLAANQTDRDSDWAGDTDAPFSITTTSSSPTSIVVRYVVEDPSNPYSF